MGRRCKRYDVDGTCARGGRSRPPLVVALSILILLTGALVWLLGSRLTAGHAASTQGSATMLKDPQTAELFIRGHDLVIAEEVAGIPEGTSLGSFSFTVFFSGQIVDVSVSEGPFLSSTGRSTDCFTSSFENLVQFGCTSVGSQPGPTGSGVLAFITVRPKPGLVLRPSAGNGIIAVLDDLADQAALSDPLGESIPVGNVLDAVVTVRALQADLNRDCVVDVVDEQIISYRYQATFGSILYNSFYDLEPPAVPDGDIDIGDLQSVYGRDGTACEGVTPPAPTPTPGATPTPCLDNDSDTLCDGVDPDDDNDGLPDDYEAAHSCLDPLTADDSADADADGLSNLQEFELGTDPCKADTDGDGCKDGRELSIGFDPLNPWDLYDVPVAASNDPTPNGTGDQAVNLQDLVGVLKYMGTDENGSSNGRVDYDSDKGIDTNGDTVAEIPPDSVPDGRAYDRSPGPLPNPPYDAGPPDGVVNMQDLLVLLWQVGLGCSETP
jgi:hypothetical protein